MAFFFFGSKSPRKAQAHHPETKITKGVRPELHECCSNWRDWRRTLVAARRKKDIQKLKLKLIIILTDFSPGLILGVQQRIKALYITSTGQCHHYTEACSWRTRVGGRLEVAHDVIAIWRTRGGEKISSSVASNRKWIKEDLRHVQINSFMFPHTQKSHLNK